MCNKQSMKFYILHLIMVAIVENLSFPGLVLISTNLLDTTQTWKLKIRHQYISLSQLSSRGTESKITH